MHLKLLLLALAYVGAAHAAPAVAIQIDGLNAEHLQTYLGRPGSRADDRFLHRVLGASAPGGGQIRYARAHQTTVQGPVPSTGNATARWVVGGVAPSFKSLVKNPPLSKNMLPDQGAVALNSGLALPPTVKTKGPAQTLLFLRDKSLAEALAKGGPAAAPAALGALDARLFKTLGAPKADTRYLIYSGHDTTPTPRPNVRPVALFAQHTGAPGDTVHAFGGGLWIQAAPAQAAEKLDQVDFVRAVYQKRDGKILRYDGVLGRLRAVPTDIEAQLQKPLGEGDLFAITETKHGAYIAPEGTPAQVSHGALSEALLVLAVGPGVSDATTTGFKSPGDLNRFWNTQQAAAPCDDRCQTQRAQLGDVQGLAEAWGPGAGATWLLAGGQSTPPKLSKAQTLLAAQALGRALTFGQSAIAPGGLIQTLGGPEVLEVPVADLQALQGLLDGTVALRGGHTYLATQALKASATLTGELADWRDYFLALARPSAEDAESVPFPVDAKTPWVATLAQVGAVRDATEAWAKQAAIKRLPTTAPAGRQARLLKALRALYAGPTPRFCVPSDRDARIEALESAATAFESLGLPGYAAIAVGERSGFDMRDAEAINRHFERAMRLLRHPHAAWARVNETNTWLTKLFMMPGLEAPNAETADAAARMMLLEVQARIAADTLPDAESRRSGHLGALANGFAARQEALLDETLKMGVAGGGDVAAAVIQAVIAGGGITALMSPQRDRQLQVMLRVAQGALEALDKKKGTKTLKDGERLARLMVPMLQAIVVVFQGDLKSAAGKVAEADALLTDKQALSARRSALKGLKEDQQAPPSASAPFVKMLLHGGMATIAGLQGDLKTARKRVRALIRLGEAVAQDGLKANGQAALKGHVAALARAVEAAAELLFAEGEGNEKARKKARKKALKRARSAVSKLKLDLPKGEARETGRWLVISAVVIIDAVYVADAVTGKKPDASALSRAGKALEDATSDWGATKFGYAALTALRAIHSGVTDLPGLIRGTDDLAGFVKSLGQLELAAQRLAKVLREDFPEETLMAALIKDDRVDLMFVDQLIALLEVGVAKMADLDTLRATLNARLDAQVKALAGTKGRDVLALNHFQRLMLLRDQKAPELTAKHLKLGRDASADTVFDQHRYLWDLIEFETERSAGKTGAEALTAAADHCPAMAWQLRPAQAILRAEAGDFKGAVSALRQGRFEAAQQGSGPLTASFKMDMRDGHMAVNALITVPVTAALFGRFSGSFQLGAGGSSKVSTGRFVNWSLAPEGGPADVALDSLILEAFLAMRAGDEAHVDVTLGQMLSLYQGLDPIWLWQPEGDHATVNLPARPKIQQPFAMLAVLTLAEARGHTGQARALLNVLLQRGLEDGPVGPVNVCDDNSPELAEDAHDLLKASQCKVAASLNSQLTEPAAKALAALTHARLRAQFDPGPSAPQQMRDALTALSKLDPKLLPKWSLDQFEATVMGNKKHLGALPKGAQALIVAQASDKSQFVVAGKNGYPCEASISGAPAVESLSYNHVCVNAAHRLMGLLKAAGESKGSVAWHHARDAVDIAWRNQNLHQQTLPPSWAALRKALFDADPGWRANAAQRAAEAAELATRYKAPAQARFFQAAAFAFQIANGQAVKMPPLDTTTADDPAGALLHRLRYGTKADLKKAADAFIKAQK